MGHNMSQIKEDVEKMRKEEAEKNALKKSIFLVTKNRY